ncbi:MAG TPA: WecB/TagA/CpsF family glycosyltransferase [Bacteroidota bacterium]|nr:WecB/TagA/CpsF family glycosyltransferase [Bacteroidota bacterium]
MSHKSAEPSRDNTERHVRPTVRVISVDLSRLDLNETMEQLCVWIDRAEKKRICVTPVNCLLEAQKDKNLRKIYNSSDMNLADGVPTVWASRFLGHPIHGRVTGLDLLPAFAEIAAQRKYSFFFLGAKEGVASTLASVLTARHPALKIAGVYSPPFAENFSEEENAAIARMINAVKPDVLWVSLTAPKQDFWIYNNFHRLDVKVALGVGGAFEVTAGIIARAPGWMQNCGLEWFFRFLQEPRRLFRRYFIEAPVFIPLVMLQKMGLLKDERGV